MSLLLSLSICASVTSFYPPVPAQNRDDAMLDRIPMVAGRRYRCEEMVRVVNYLRKMGKEKSLSALRQYLGRTRNHGEVLLVCRLLFVNPKGWQPPILG